MPDRDLSFDLAEHAVRYDAVALTADVARHQAFDLVDTLGVALGGVNAPGVPATRDYLGLISTPGDTTVWGTALRWNPLAAAQANATAAHALDYDDTLDEGGAMHAGAATHAAALAVADALGGVSGREYIAATAVGLDIAVRLALSTTADFGWHRTSAFGIFAATVAAGRLLNLDVDQMRHALGIAYSQASGNRQCIPDGALSKRLQAGFAARDAVTAVELARRGLTGAHNAFEGRDGFFKLYQRDAYTRDTITDGLGQTLLTDRISLKPYPCGRPLHGVIDSALEIRARAGSENITRISVGVDARQAAGRREFPTHVVEAQFSIPFVVALALATGITPLRAFDDPASVPSEVRALFDKVEMAEGTGPDGAAVVTATYADGRTEHASNAVYKGNPQRPLSEAELEAKVLDCVASAGEPISVDAARRLFRRVLAVDTLASTNELSTLLAGSALSTAAQS